MDYNKNFLEYKNILTDEEKKYIEDISNQYEIQHLFVERNINDTSVDFAYTNAKVEGCTYTYQEAETLLLSGRTANNKSFHDAQMIINLKDAYVFIMENKIKDITAPDIKNLHRLVMNNVLPENQVSEVRKIPVRIGGSDYLPSTDTILLEESIKEIISNSKKYDNTFEKSIYLHNNLAYLQYFTDGNKRISRIVQTASLVGDDKMPLFYLDDNISDYKKLLVTYYETGNYKEYKDYFLNNYENSLEKTVKFLKKRDKKQSKNKPKDLGR